MKLQFNVLSKIWLILSSLFFYGYWDLSYLPIIIGSIIFNFICAVILFNQKTNRTLITLVGVLTNLGLLFYFKYLYFFNLQVIEPLGFTFTIDNLILPLGISFFTFQQIAFLVDIYKGKKLTISFIDYSLFVSFFPQLIAGPIVHHAEMMPQFYRRRKRAVVWRNLSLGLCIFAIGLFKKVVIADSLSVWVDLGYSSTNTLTSLDSWLLSLAYTFQLYYDFSGYADMAIGIALMFGIKLPLNFNSPYRAVSIQDFWRRWHMTLSRWFRDYVYIPLGGGRVSKKRTLFNLFITAFLSGIWHGAGWTFFLWGALHGAAMVINRMWQSLHFRLNTRLAIFCTFLFINFTWVFFRAETLSDANLVISKMLNLKVLASDMANLQIISLLENNLKYILSLPTATVSSNLEYIILLILTLIALEKVKKDKKVLYINSALRKHVWLCPVLLCLSFWFMSVETVEKFIYFNF